MGLDFIKFWTYCIWFKYNIQLNHLPTNNSLLVWIVHCFSAIINYATTPFYFKIRFSFSNNGTVIMRLEKRFWTIYLKKVKLATRSIVWSFMDILIKIIITKFLFGKSFKNDVLLRELLNFVAVRAEVGLGF